MNKSGRISGIQIVLAVLVVGLLGACCPDSDWSGTDQIEMHLLEGLPEGDESSLSRVQPLPDGGFFAAGSVLRGEKRTPIVAVMDADGTTHHHPVFDARGWPKFLSPVVDGAALLIVSDDSGDTDQLLFHRIRVGGGCCIEVNSQGTIPVGGRVLDVYGNQEQVLVLKKLDADRVGYQVVDVANDLTPMVSAELPVSKNGVRCAWDEGGFTIVTLYENEWTVIQLDDTFQPSRVLTSPAGPDDMTTLMTMAVDEDRIVIVGVSHTQQGTQMIERQHVWYGSVDDDSLQHITLELEHVIIATDVLFLNDEEIVICGMRPVQLGLLSFCKQKFWNDVTFLRLNLSTGEFVEHPRGKVDSWINRMAQGADGKVYGVGSFLTRVDDGDTKRDAAWFVYDW